MKIIHYFYNNRLKIVDEYAIIYLQNVIRENVMIARISVVKNEKLHFDYKLYKKQSEPILHLEHFHDGFEIICILNGKVKYVVEGQEYYLQKHDVIFARPNVYHYLETAPDCEYERYNLIFAPTKKFQNICKNLKEIFIFNCANKPIIFQIFSKMNYYVSSFEQDVALSLIQNLCEELLYNFTLIKDDDLLSPKNCSPLIQESLSYIKENLFTITEIEEISQALFVSKSKLFKSFKDELKISPKKYILNLRLHLAHTLIMSGESPSSVYLKCGFTSYNTFYKSFFNYYGHAPSATQTHEPKK